MPDLMDWQALWHYALSLFVYDSVFPQVSTHTLR